MASRIWNGGVYEMLLVGMVAKVKGDNMTNRRDFLKQITGGLGALLALKVVKPEPKIVVEEVVKPELPKPVALQNYDNWQSVAFSGSSYWLWYPYEIKRTSS